MTRSTTQPLDGPVGDNKLAITPEWRPPTWTSDPGAAGEARETKAEVVGLKSDGVVSEIHFGRDAKSTSNCSEAPKRNLRPGHSRLLVGGGRHSAARVRFFGVDQRH